MEPSAETPEPDPPASPSPSPPTSPTSPTSPTTPTTPDEVKFKSMLQVLLKTKQEDELSKNIEYKEKLEGEEEDEEEEGRKKEKPRETEEQGEERGVKGKENKKRDQGEDGRNDEGKGKIKTREKEEGSKNVVNEKEENKKKSDKPSKDEKETSESKNKREAKIKHKEEVNRDKEVKKSKETGTKEENKNKENKEKEELKTKEKKGKEENEKKEKRQTESNNNKENKDKELGKNTEKKQNKEEEEKKSKKEDIESKSKEITKKTDQNKKDESEETKEGLKEKDKAKKKEEKTKEKDTKKKEEEKTKEKKEEKTKEKKEEKTKEKKEEKTKEKKSEEKPKETKENEEKTRETKENEEKTKEKRKEAKPAEKREVSLPKIEVDEVTSGPRSDAADQGRPPSTSSSSTSSPARSTLTPGSSSTKVKGEEGGRAEGILHKKGKGPFGSWKRYYFVLKGQLLMYYYSEHDYKELAGFKGSLDLTMLEEVSEKKRGFLKTHFPFALGRRNLKHIVLAAETSEERDHWMSVLRSSLLRPTGGSGNRSDSNLPAPRAGDTPEEKSATLPARSKMSPATSSLSESEDEDKKVEAKEDAAKQEEEEPKLIQPKKVQRIPVNPLGAIRIDAVKLRKVDRRPSDAKDKAEGDDPPKELDPEATFGVKLKKHLSPRGDVGEAREAKETSLTPSPKRPNKNPIIPLGKSPLLSRPEGELLKTSSPETQRRGGTPERKKSPSPSIPLSRGVHSVLAKSGDEGDEEREGRGAQAGEEGVDARGRESRQKNPPTKASRSPSSSSSSESEKEEEKKDKEESKEKKAEDEDKPKETEHRPSKVLDPDAQFEPQSRGGEGEKDKAQERAPEDSERARGSASPEAKEDSPSSFSSASRDQDLSSQGSLSRQGSEAEFLQVSVTLKESAGDESEYDQLDEDVLRSVKPSGTPDGEQERRASEASPKPPSPLHTPSTSETSSPASIRALSENEKPRLPKPDGGSAGATPPRSPFRRRSNTNDSSGSCKSEPETPEKKSGKFKAIFGRNRSGSLDVGRADSGKGDYEVKGKNSSAFSKFLQRKMSKEKKEKVKEEREGSSPDMRKNSEAAEGAAAAEPAIPREAREADAPSTPVPTLNVVPALPEENEGPREEDVAVTLRCGFQASGESRGSTYSRSSSASREQEPPPMVPEKTRIREKSPVHDIPRSNRPVPGMSTTPKEEPRAVEDKVVDGNISLEQINAILSAKESKKRLSREREGSLEGDAAKGLAARRPSSISTTSVESDEPLPKTNFIDCDISSSSSGSLKDQARSRDSVGSGDHVRLSADLEAAAAADAEASVTLRKPKLTVSLTAGPRVSLTQPEFTVVEEDVATSPETERQTRSASPDDRGSESEMDDDDDEEEDEEAEQSDYFPGVGVEVRQPSPTNLKLSDSPTLGITRLKAFIGEMEKEDAKTSSVRTGISRLGHSAAVEKLKEEITEDPRD